MSTRLVMATVLVLAACTNEAVDRSIPPPPGGSRSPAAATPSPAEPTGHAVSLPAMFDEPAGGRALRLRGELGRTDDYVRHRITYRAGDLTISGLMNVPPGDGPFPVVVLLHGYIDPDVYTTGRGFERSQDRLPRAGFAVLHTDYRNHAASDDDPTNDVRLRLGYVQDAVAAVEAIRRSRLPFLDPDRVAFVGHSMGGGVALAALVTHPDLVDAAVLYAPVSSDAVDNFRRWIDTPERAPLARRIIRRYGSPEEAPDFWAGVSPRSYLDRVAVPLRIHHGTADESVPLAWSRATTRVLQRAGADVRLHVYPGDRHDFSASGYEVVIARTIRFLRRTVR